ncbi:Uma2 family endonuclease [Eubacterium sp.]|uniref:Uma2 family endonuclease n=1 Tax=Eubacterium sp. TaxID=142586 RepID=UPI002FC69D29
MTQVIRLEQGECTQCPEGNCELINGVVYEKAALDDKGVGAVRYLHAAYSKFRLAHRPLDKVADPQAELVFPQLENTILKPEIAVTVNGMEFPQWVVEFADDNNEEISYLLKPALYRDAGVAEYWVIDPDREVILIYSFERSGLVPLIIEGPQRIRVSIYKNFFLSFSDFFKYRGERK